MTVRKQGDSRPDHTSSIVGEEGIPVKQDYDGTQIQRLGIAGADADWGPEKMRITNSLVAVARPDSVGGTKTSSGYFESTLSNNFSVIYVWTDGETQKDSIGAYEAASTSVVEAPGEIQDSPLNIVDNITTKSDHAIVYLKDESPEDKENRVKFTLNFH